MNNAEITARVLEFIVLILAYCASASVAPTDYDFLGIKFKCPECHKWRLRTGIFQGVTALTLFAWANFHLGVRKVNYGSSK